MKTFDIVILGGGESGAGAAVLASGKDYARWCRIKAISKINTRYLLKEEEIDFEENKHSEDLILRAGEIIKSPGIPDSAPF